MKKMEAEAKGVQTPLIDVPYARILEGPRPPYLSQLPLTCFGVSNEVFASKDFQFYVVEQFLRHNVCHLLEEAKVTCPRVWLALFPLSPMASRHRISCGENRAPILAIPGGLSFD
jgi:hypothetical protein